MFLKSKKDGYIYVRQHRSYGDCVKLGKTVCPIHRDLVYVTGELWRGEYKLILKIIEGDYDFNECETLLQDKFERYHVKKDGGTEFYKKEILSEIEGIFDEYGIQYEEMDINDINIKIRTRNIVENNVKSKIRNRNKQKLREKMRERRELNESKNNKQKQKQLIKDIKWFERRYQKQIIDEGTKNLTELGKFYLELATGGGKTYIVYSIFKNIDPDTIRL